MNDLITLLPKDEDEILDYLLCRDKALFWPTILAVKGAPVLNIHSKVKTVCSILIAFKEQLESRSLRFLRTLHVLSKLQEDDHETINKYIIASDESSTYDSKLPINILKEVEEFRCRFDELEHFSKLHCRMATDVDLFFNEIKKVKREIERGIILSDMNDHYWGKMLDQELRSVTRTIFQLCSSVVFCDQWVGLVNGKELKVKDLVTHIYADSIKFYQEKVLRLLDSDNLVTIGEVAQVFGNPSNDCEKWRK